MTKKSDEVKRITEWALTAFLKLAEKKQGRTLNEMESDLANTPLEHYRDLWQLVLDMSEATLRPYQARMIRRFGAVVLWTALKDTVYRDQFEWALAEVSKMVSVSNIEPKEPKDWYVNLWAKAIDETQKAGFSAPEEAPFNFLKSEVEFEKWRRKRGK